MKMRMGLVMAAVALVALAIVSVQGLAADAPASGKAPATASAPADGKTFTGTATRSGSQHRPQLMVGEKRYELKASDKAAADVKDTLKKITDGDVSKYTVVGKEISPEGGRPNGTIEVYTITKAAEDKK